MIVKSVFMFSLLSIAFYSCSNNDDSADAYGNFEAEEILISSQLGGPIDHFYCEEGDLLSKGDLIGTIDTVPMVIQKKQLMARRAAVLTQLGNLEAETKVQKVQIGILEKEYARVSRLFESGAATEKQKDDLQGSLELANSKLKAIESRRANVYSEISVIESQVLQVDDQIRRAHIFAPQDGTVLETYAQQHEVAAPGRSLLKLADLSKVYLKAYVSGAQLAQLSIGEAVTVFIDLDDKMNQSMQGKVSWIAQEAEFTPKIIQTKEERVNLVYAIKIIVENDGRIKIGMPGECRFN